MTTTATGPAEIETMSDLLERLGDIPPWRVLMKPLPGTATVQDVLDVRRTTGKLCELVDGTLVEKGMGYRESALAGAILFALRAFIVPRNLGIVTGESGMMRLFAGLVRIPDVAYVSWKRVPGGRMPTTPVPKLAPNLAVEVLSESNSPKEMDKKCREYFKAGVELVWIFDPKLRTVEVYTSPKKSVIRREHETLTGGSVLPGLELSLHELFAELDRTAPQ